MKVIAVSNPNACVGKTLTTINLASHLVANNKKVLVITDAESCILSGLVDIEAIESTFSDCIINNENAENIILSTSSNGLKFLPFYYNLQEAETEFMKKDNRESLIKKAIVNFKNNFDFILIDTPSSLGITTINSMVASDSVLIPVPSNINAFKNIHKLFNIIKIIKNKLNYMLEIEGMFLTTFDPTNKLSMQIKNELYKHFSEISLKTNIINYINTSEYILHEVGSDGYKNFSQFSLEFLKK